MEAVDNISSKAELLLEHVRNNKVEKIRKLVGGNQELLKYKYEKPFGGKTIIHIVCSTFADEVGKETVETLIELGADLCEYDDHTGFQPIHWAALSLNADLLEIICGKLEGKTDSKTAKFGMTALLLIINKCDCESKKALKCIELLLKHKVDVNIANELNGYPIWFAARRQYMRVVDLLLSANYKIDIDTCPIGEMKTARDLIIEYNLYDKKKLPKKTISNSVQSSLLSRILKKTRKEDAPMELQDLDQQPETNYSIEIEQSISEPEHLLLEYVRNNEVRKIRQLVEGNWELLKYWYDKSFGGKTIIHIVCSTLADEVEKETVKALIDLGADLCEYDLYGYQSIHLAALSLNAKLLEIICQQLKEKIDNKTKNGQYTALLLIIERCDCESRDALECIEVLLEHKADVNKTGYSNKCPIWCAADKGYKRVVGLLLSRYPKINIDSCPYGESNTARDLIMEDNLYDKNNLPPITEREILLRKIFGTLMEGREDDFLKIKDIKSFVHGRFQERTMLQICAELNLLKCARHLVELGAEVEHKVLEITTRNGHFEMFEKLSVKLDEIPEFLLQFDKEPQTVKSNFKECLRLLLDNNKSLVNKEVRGIMPLHWACIWGGDEDVIQMLLKYGANLNSTDEYGNVAIDGIKTEHLRNHFNNCITCDSDNIDYEDLKVAFDYQTLVPRNDSDYKEKDTELSLISHIARRNKLRPLLTNPLITSFIHMKWNRFKWFFYANLLLYLIGWISLFFYTMNEYSNKADYEEGPSGSQIFLLVLIWMTFILFIAKEIIQFVFSPIIYIKQMENYLEGAFIISIALILFWPEPSDNTRKQISAFTIMVSNFQLVLLLRQLPCMSTYIIMLRTVSFSFLKLLVWNAILILSFAFSFYTLFANNTKTNEKQSSNNSTSHNEGENAFNGVWVSIFKTFVMMTGEFDADDIKFDTIPFASRILFVLFIFIIVIVLSNLMSGLAVSDTQEIKINAEFLALKLRVDHICYIENILLGSMTSVLLKLLKLCKISRLNFKMPHPKKLTLMTYLLANYLEPSRIDVHLNKKGKIVLPEETSPLRNSHGWLYKKIFETVRLDRKTLKNVRLLLKERNSFKKEDSAQEMLETINDSMQQKLRTVDDTMKDLKTVVNSLQKKQVEMEHQQKQILQNLNAISENMNKILERLN